MSFREGRAQRIETRAHVPGAEVTKRMACVAKRFDGRTPVFHVKAFDEPWKAERRGEEPAIAVL